ncbi:MAG: RHS repeat-associated core domain-containing protein [Chitinophagales bacterium]
MKLTRYNVKHHYPFGMLTPGRNWSAGSEYRFGFNGYETVDDIIDNNNIFDFGGRYYDARLCRFMSLDPLYMKSIWRSPYSFAANSPIIYMDLGGLDINGGFSVVNNSQQPVILVGNGERTTKTITYTPFGPIVTYSFQPLNSDNNGNLLNTFVVLEPNQMFVTTVTKESEYTTSYGGVSITIIEYKYAGAIIDMSDGTLIAEVNIFDVDGIDLTPDQSVTLPSGQKLNESNSVNEEKNLGFVRYDSDGDKKGDDRIDVKFKSGEINSARAATGLPPLPTNDSIITVSGTTSLRLDIVERPSKLNDPSFKYPEIKE